MKCKVCGRNSESEYCFRHKPRKTLAGSTQPARREPLGVVNLRVLVSQRSFIFYGDMEEEATPV